jgi:phosphomethylpyrimidine synthase
MVDGDIITAVIYDSAGVVIQRDLATLTAKDFIDVVRLHAEDGVDFVTLHCGITRKTIDQIKNHKRKMNIVSRGGSLEGKTYVVAYVQRI